jgi:hypothetical protein
MENETRTRNSRKRGRTEAVVEVTAREEKGISVLGSSRSSSRRRQVPISETNSGIGAPETAELTSTNDSLQPQESSPNGSSQGSSGELKNSSLPKNGKGRHFTRSRHPRPLTTDMSTAERERVSARKRGSYQDLFVFVEKSPFRELKYHRSADFGRNILLI